MADEKVLNSESSEVEDMTPDYVAAIKELKQNSVDKAKYDALRLENKKLLDAVVNGIPVEVQSQVHKEDIQTLRNKVFNNPNQTNLEYITNALNLRNRLLEEGYLEIKAPAELISLEVLQLYRFLSHLLTRVTLRLGLIHSSHTFFLQVRRRL